MLGPIDLSGSCAGDLFMGVLWFLVIIGVVTVLRELTRNANKGQCDCSRADSNQRSEHRYQ